MPIQIHLWGSRRRDRRRDRHRGNTPDLIRNSEGIDLSAEHQEAAYEHHDHDRNEELEPSDDRRTDLDAGHGEYRRPTARSARQQPRDVGEDTIRGLQTTGARLDQAEIREREVRFDEAGENEG